MDDHEAELLGHIDALVTAGDSAAFQDKYISILFADPAGAYDGTRLDARLGVLQRSLAHLLEASELNYSNFLIEASVSELIYSFGDAQAAIAFAEPFIEGWLEPLIGVTGSAYAWIDCLGALRLEGELGRAEALAIELEGILEGLLEAETEPSERRDALLTAGIFVALADHQVQMALGLPDFSRDRLRTAQDRLDGLSGAFEPVDRAIFAANIKEEECNLWALADRHERRARVAREAFEILSESSLGSDAEIAANAALAESPYAGLLEAIRVRLSMHLAVGDLVNAISGEEGEIDSSVDAALSEMRQLTERPDLGVSSALRIWARIGREELRLGRLGAAKLASDRAAELLASEAGESGASPIAQLGVETLRARIGQAAGASRDERSEQLAGLKSGLWSILEEWDQSDLREGGLGFLDFALRREVVVASVGFTAELEGQAPAIELLMEVQKRGSLDRTLGLEAPSLEAIRSTLCTADSGVLCFVPGLDDLLIVALDASELRVLRRPLSRFDLARIKRLREGLARPGLGSKPDADAVELGKLLLGGEVSELLRNWSAVHIVGKDLLREVPFEVLDWGGEYFGLQMAISYLPSLPVGVALAERWSEAGWAPPELIFGELDGRTVGLSDARLSAEQRRALEASLPRAARVRPIAADTVSRVRSGGLAGVGFATVFAHGKLDLRRARPSGLWLGPAPEQILWCADVSHIDTAQVMILSACGAARTNARLGDGGVGSLGGALMEAGSLSVVLAGAEVPRDATVLLTAELQGRISEGEPIATALLEARRAVAHRGAFEDPYHWANFQVLGVGNRALASMADPAGRITPALVVGGLALAAGLALLARRRRRAVPEHRD